MAIQEPNAGELNRRVVLRRRSDLPDADGGLSSLFSDKKNRWARITPVGTAIYHGSTQAEDKITHRVVMRYLGVIPIDFEVVHRDVVYRVKRAAPMNGGRRFTLLEVEELGQIQAEGDLYG